MMTLFRDEVLTKYVPAVAVKRATRVLIDLTRRKGFVGGLIIFSLGENQVKNESPASKVGIVFETGKLELKRGDWNTWYSGGMH